MLTDRSETNRVFADRDEVAGPWWQDRAQSWAQAWSRRAIDSRVTISVSPATTLSIADQLCRGTAELRWKRFLLRASRWEERAVRDGGLN